MIFFDRKVAIPRNMGTVRLLRPFKSEYTSVQLKLSCFRPELKSHPYDKHKMITLGRLCEDDPDYMYPNNKFRFYFPEEFAAGIMIAPSESTEASELTEQTASDKQDKQDKQATDSTIATKTKTESLSKASGSSKAANTSMDEGSSALKLPAPPAIPEIQPLLKWHHSSDKSGGLAHLIELCTESHLRERLEKHFDKSDAALLLDLAFFSIEENGRKDQSFADYCRKQLPFSNTHLVSEQEIREFFQRISPDSIYGFMKEWNKDYGTNDEIYISYRDIAREDVTDFEKGSSLYEYTDNPAFYDVVGIAYNSYTNIPLYYTWATHNSYLIFENRNNWPESFMGMYKRNSDFGYSNSSLLCVIDQYSFNSEVIDTIVNNGSDFCMMLNSESILGNRLIAEHKGSFEGKKEHAVNALGVYGITFKHVLFKYNGIERYAYVFFDPIKQQEERLHFASYKKKIERQIELFTHELDTSYKEHKQCLFFGDSEHYPRFFDLNVDESKHLISYKRKEGVLEELKDHCGYLCMISSKQLSIKEAYRLYLMNNDDGGNLLGLSGTFMAKAYGRKILDECYGYDSIKLFIEFLARILMRQHYTLLLAQIQKYI